MKIKGDGSTIINIERHYIASEGYIKDTRSGWRCEDLTIDFAKKYVDYVNRVG